MTVSEWLDANRQRLLGRGDEWVARRVAVLEVPGRTLTLGFQPEPPEPPERLFADSQEPVLSSCVVEIGSEERKPVLHRVIEDPPPREFEARRLIA
jgi:hypothetical protein